MTYKNFWADADIISTYSRAQALEDGFLVEVPAKLAKEAGIIFPVAYTHAVHALLEDMPRSNDYTGRLWDMLNMFRNKARRTAGSEFLFQFILASKKGGRKLTTLKAHCGPGDTPAPVITIMLPDED